MLINLFKSLGKIGGFTPLFLYAALMPGLGVLILAGNAQEWYEPFKELVIDRMWIFILAGALLAGLSLIPTHAASLVGGMIFGAVMGPVFALISIILASVISYIVTRKILGDSVMEFISLNDKAHKVYKELLSFSGFRTVFIISLIRLSPIMPFAATNVLLSATKVNWWQFITGSAIGLAPRVIIVAVAGSALSTIDLNQEGNKSLLAVGIAATVLAVYFIGKISKKALTKITNSKTLHELGSD